MNQHSAVDQFSADVNEQLVLICGESATGKSASLLNIKNQERWLYLNCESNKRLPFRNKFWNIPITDPFQIYEAFENCAPGGALDADVDGIIIDTLTFLMDMFESKYVIGSSNTQAAWGQYAQFLKRLMQQHVASSSKSVIFMAHTKTDQDERSMSMTTSVPVKGSLKGNGVEAFFSTVVATKKVSLKVLESQDPSLLHITPQDEALGYKHVFQTQLTKETIGERIRSPMGMFAPNQVFMDNDAQLLLQHLRAFYAG